MKHVGIVIFEFDKKDVVFNSKFRTKNLHIVSIITIAQSFNPYINYNYK